ncbi:MAG TPA: glycosyltransferase, partial [Geminocystis sp. M7585_C2015_104]|nr:glycosyltransferase [Geminocystis sp. M7585_C2015_104]
SGYGFTLPPKVPIIAVSKHTQAYWGRHAPNSLIFYLPNEISPEYQNRHQDRPIDVLVQKRKSSKYLLEKLVPALKPHCNLVLIDSWVEDLASLFNQTKVYLYDSSEYWWQTGLTEGFGLPPLEAMACGCTVFSSINDALSDYLDPGFNCQKLRVYSLEYDVHRILNAVKNWQLRDNTELLRRYRREAIEDRLKTILEQIDFFFNYQKIVEKSNIPSLSGGLVERMIGRIKKKIGGVVKR